MRHCDDDCVGEGVAVGLAVGVVVRVAVGVATTMAVHVTALKLPMTVISPSVTATLPHLQCPLCKAPRHRVCGIPPVPRVSREVEPQGISVGEMLVESPVAVARHVTALVTLLRALAGGLRAAGTVMVIISMKSI